MNFRKIKTVNSIPITLRLVVWCHLDGYPWWPAVVVNREEHEPNLDPGEFLVASSEENRLVEFFNDDKRVAVVDLEFLREYTSNIHLCRQSTKLKNQIHIACEEANAYIETQGLESQKALYEDLESFEVLKKGKLTRSHISNRRSIAEPSQDGTEASSAPSSSKRRSTSKYRRQAEAEASVKDDQIEPLRRDLSPPPKRRKFKDSRPDEYDDDSESSAKKLKEKPKKSARGSSAEREDSPDSNGKGSSRDRLSDVSKRSLVLKKNKEKGRRKSTTDLESDPQTSLDSKMRKKAKAERKASKLEKRSKGKSKGKDRMKNTEPTSKFISTSDAEVDRRADSGALEESKPVVEPESFKEPDAPLRSKLKAKLKGNVKQKVKTNVKPKGQDKFVSKTKTVLEAVSEPKAKLESNVFDVLAETSAKSDSKKSKIDSESNTRGKGGALNRRQHRTQTNQNDRDTERDDMKISKADDVRDKIGKRIIRHNSDKTTLIVDPKSTRDEVPPKAEDSSDDSDDVVMDDDDDRPSVEMRDVAAVMAQEDPKDSDLVPYEDLDRIDTSNIPSVDETLTPTSELKVDFEDLQVNVVRFIEGLQDIAYSRDLLKKKIDQTKQVRLDVHMRIQKLNTRNVTVEQLQATQVGGKIVAIIEKTWENSPFLAEELVPLAESWSEVASRAADAAEASGDRQQNGGESREIQKTLGMVKSPLKKGGLKAEVNENNSDVESKHAREDMHTKASIRRKMTKSPSTARSTVKHEDEKLHSKSAQSVKVDRGEPGKVAESLTVQSLESSSSLRRGPPTETNKRRRSEEERVQIFGPERNRQVMNFLLNKFKLEEAVKTRLVEMFLHESEIRSNGDQKLYFNNSKKIVVKLKSNNGHSLVKKALENSSAANFFE